MEKNRLGIDFGTTYSCVGVWKDGGVVIIPNQLGERTTPSVVLFESPTLAYVGEETINRLPKNDSFKIYEIKRLIGKRYDEVKDLIKYFAFKVVKQKDGDRPVIQITYDNGETIEYTPELIASLIIKKLIQNACNYLKQIVNEVIITVPADFNDYQRNGIVFAAQSIPGIKVIQLINEPCAAVLSYGFPSTLMKNWLFPFNQNYTLIKENKSNSNHPMEEMFGNNNDFGNANLFNWSLKVSPTISTNSTNHDENKINNHNENKTKNVIVFDLGGGTYDVSLIEISESTFETRSSSGNQFLGGGDLDNILMEYCLEEFYKTNKIHKEEIKNSYKCMQRLKSACERSKKILSIKTEDTIYIEDFYKDQALNCFITRAKFENLCNIFFNKLIPPIDRVLNDINLKAEDINEIILVGGSSRIPKIKEILKEKFPKKDIINDSINPDEAVAFGAAIFAESLIRNTGEFWEDFQYLDTTRSSLGIEVEDGTLDVIIKKGSRYPTNNTRLYTNAYDDQYTIEIKVYEGEDLYANNNKLLAEFTLRNFPKKKKNELCIPVTFEIDENQILKVTAYVDNFIARQTVTVEKKDIYNGENIPLKLGNISLIGDDLSKEEKKLKVEIFSYSKQFQTLTTEQDKYKLIQNYNKSIINYLKFLEDKCNDIESEKYLFLIEKLFKSYCYCFKTQLNVLIPLNEKINIEKNIELYLSKIYRKNPYRIKHLLGIFKDINHDISDIFYKSSLYSMKELQKLAEEYFSKKNNNSLLISKVIYEECLLIGNLSFEINNVLVLLDNELFREYIEVKEECENKIKIISVDSFYIIQLTKQNGKLFSNEKHYDYDNLCLLSTNLFGHLKKLNDIEDLNEKKEALEIKSICLANIVKIEFLKNKPNNSFPELLKYSNESIKIAKELGEICTNKEWYKEIIQLEEDIKKKMSSLKPAPSVGDFEVMEQEFKQNFELGVEHFLRFLLTKYPYDGCVFSEEMIQEFNKDKRNYLRKLYKNYNKLGPSIVDSNNNNIDQNTQKKNLIKKYINNCINQLAQ